MSITHGGNVGIGTPSPDKKLTVAGDIGLNQKVLLSSASADVMSLQPTDSNNDSYQARLNLYKSTHTTYPNEAHLYMGEGSGAKIIFGKEGGGNAEDPLMTILPTGHVGIGTTSPSAPLDVAGAANFGGEVWIVQSGALGTGGNLNLINPAKSANGVAQRWALYNMGNGYGNSLQFWAYDNMGCQPGGLCAQRMVITDSGQVGIGTYPSANTGLQVQGQIATVLPNELAPTGTTQAIDFATGNMQMVNLASASGNVILTLSNPVAGGSYAIKFTQGSTARAVIWPANVKWAEGNVMALSTAAGAIDLVTLFYDGTAYLAVGGRNFY
jgi:hypothetical protein